MTETTTPTRPLARATFAAGLLPAAIAAGGAVLIQSWRDELPSPVAIHWGPDGTADDFAEPGTVTLIVAGLGLLFAIIGAVLVVLMRRDALLCRAVAATTAGTTAFVTVLVTVLTADQRGLADAAEAGISAMSIVGSLAVAALVAALAGWIVPPGSGEPSADVSDDAPRLPVDPAERVVWTRSVATGSHGVAVLVASIGVTVVTGLLTQQWWVLGIAALLIVTVAVMYSITVTVDRHGLTVRGRLGWPRMRTPIDEIEQATVVDVNPIRHFGGYGYRIALFGPMRGASAFVLRGGQGLVVDRTGGRRQVVVVDDAFTAAGLLNSLVRQARQ